MNYHKAYESLRFIIPCRECGGVGHPECCLSTGQEAITAAEKVTEDKAQAGLRFQAICLGFEFLDIERLEV